MMLADVPLGSMTVMTPPGTVVDVVPENRVTTASPGRSACCAIAGTNPAHVSGRTAPTMNGKARHMPRHATTTRASHRQEAQNDPAFISRETLGGFFGDGKLPEWKPLAASGKELAADLLAQWRIIAPMTLE